MDYLIAATRALFGWMFGFGYSPLRATISFAILIYLGGMAVRTANSDLNLMIIDSVPVSSVVRGHNAAVPLNAYSRETLPCGDNIQATLYALDVFVPLIDLHQESKCEFGSTDEHYEQNRPIWMWLQWDAVIAWRWAKSLYALLGALVTSLTLLTFTGVLQRKDEA